METPIGLSSGSRVVVVSVGGGAPCHPLQRPCHRPAAGRPRCTGSSPVCGLSGTGAHVPRQRPRRKPGAASCDGTRPNSHATVSAPGRRVGLGGGEDRYMGEGACTQTLARARTYGPAALCSPRCPRHLKWVSTALRRAAAAPIPSRRWPPASAGCWWRFRADSSSNTGELSPHVSARLRHDSPLHLKADSGIRRVGMG